MDVTTYQMGQRVRTTVNAPAGWPGALCAPAGTLGTITNLPTGRWCSYGVLLDGDPDGLAASFTADEITPAE